MALFLKGTEAFDYAYGMYMDTVYRICVHNVRCKSDAEDLTQEVFVRLLSYEKCFLNSEHLKSWLIRVTLNLCYDFSKKESNRVSAEDNYLRENSVVSDGSDLLECVFKLPPNYKNAIYLHYYEGYTAKEIARILKTKENTVLSWLKRGRSQLKEMMGDDFIE